MAMMLHTREYSRPETMARCRGIALFLSLVILLVTTILGVSSVRTSYLQERMSRGALDTSMAFQAAEAALHDAENHIDSLTEVDAMGEGPYSPAHPEAEIRNPDTVDSRRRTPLPGVAQPGRYIIEHVKTLAADEQGLNLDHFGQGTGSARLHIFRITAIGTGGTTHARVVLQSTYGKLFQGSSH